LLRWHEEVDGAKVLGQTMPDEDTAEVYQQPKLLLNHFEW